jgi:hypothetical protein
VRNNYGKVWRGTFNSFTVERTPVENVWVDGGTPLLWVSPDKTVYYFFNIYYTANHYIARRDPLTGVWTDTFLYTSPTWFPTAPRAIVGKNDADILFSAGETYWWNGGPGYCHHFDGASWTLKQNTGYSPPGGMMMLWSAFTTRVIPTPPYLAAKSPSPDSVDIAKDRGVSFLIGDDHYQVELSSVKIWVQNKLIFTSLSFASGWTKSQYESSGFGFIFALVTNLKFTHLDKITVRVYGENSTGLSVDESWRFTVCDRPFNFKIYNFLFTGIRKGDEVGS